MTFFENLTELEACQKPLLRIIIHSLYLQYEKQPKETSLDFENFLIENLPQKLSV